jgi:Na+/H+ antiporter NhaD/arsenite permease-like protein
VLDLAGIIIVAILVVTLVVIISERVNETATVLFAMSIAGGVLYLAYGYPFKDFVLNFQWDTILFVTAMMIVVAIAASSGMFQYISLVLIRRTRANAKRIFWTFMGFVFLMSLFLDPLPTMMVMGPFTVEVCRALDLDFRPLLISEVVIANIASIPSFVGSVPNLVIAILTEVNVAYMFVVLMPLSLMMFLASMFLLLRYYGDKLELEDKSEWNVLYMIRPGIMIKSRHDFYLSGIAMAILILGFTIGALRVEASLIAMMVASAMLVFSHERAKDLLRTLSWDTVFFLVGLFGLVAALDRAGVVTELVNGVTSLIGGNVFLAIGFMIWIPGLGLSMIDNIPVATLLAPIARVLSSEYSIVPLTLIVGANIGGYIIPFGDAPNMIAVSLAADEGRPISFRDFTRVAFPLGLLHLVMGTVYSMVVALLV